MKIAICDDDPIFRQHLANRIIRNSKPASCELVQFADGSSLIEAYQGEPGFDLILLDLEMPKMNGQEAAQIIRKIDHRVILIILTSHVDFARYAFELDVHRYILKTEIDERLDEALETAYGKIEKRRLTVSFTTEAGDYRKIPIRQIEFVEYVNHRTVIHTREETYRLRTATPLHEIETALPESDFVSCYKGIIVNVACIASISNKHILLINGQELPLSRQSKNKVYEIFKQYLEGHD